MEVPHEDPATTCRVTPHATANLSVSPSLWRSVVQAFRQAQLVRLEARVQRVRQSVSCASTPHEHPVLLVPTERMRPDDRGWLPVTTSRPRRQWWTVVVIGLLTLTGVSLSVVLLRSPVTLADAPAPHPDVPGTSMIREMTNLRALVSQLDARVTVLQHQVLQQGEQLTTQAATVLSVNQHADVQQTHVIAIADALTALTSQVAHVEQQVTTHATRLTVHEQQLALQATPLGPLHAQTRDVRRRVPRASGRASRSGPPTLEMFTPPSSQAVTSVPDISPPLPTTEEQPARRSITLPAALGAAGFHTATRTIGGPQP